MLPFIVGYLDKVSATAGTEIRVMVSCTAASKFEASLVRTICGDLNPQGPGFREVEIDFEAAGTYPAREQICNAGSCVVAPNIAAYDGLQSFSFQAHIWPTTPELGEQGLICLQDEAGESFVRLIIDAHGCIAFAGRDEKGRPVHLSSGTPLTSRQWYFIAATYDASERRLTVYQEPYARSGAGEEPVSVERTQPNGLAIPQSPLVVMAAWQTDAQGKRRFTAGHYNGKLERPRLCGAAMSRLNLEMLRGDRIAPQLAPDCLGFWDFSQDIPTENIADLSKFGGHGTAINLPARAMTGANWSGEEVSWRISPIEYGAIHFHDDDLYDAQWEADFTFKVPADIKSGVYAVRLTAGDRVERIPLFVRPATGAKRASVAFLASTATYVAYANLNPVPFDIAELLSSHLIILHEANLLIDEHKEWAPSLYDIHSDGSGVCYSSRLRPILNFRPGYISSFGSHGSNLREFNADTHLLDWFEHTGAEYDVITDEDLHAEGYSLLAQYKTIVTSTHPEYFSAPMWNAVKSYTDSGGRLMVLGGNSFYWRIAYHSTLPGAMEVRRCGPAIRTWETQPGEEFHSFDGKRGGLWRAHGRPPQSIGGVGFISEGFDLGAPYRRTAASRDERAKFIFEEVEDEIIGDFGLQGGGAAAVEIDHADTSLGRPSHALVLERFH